MSGDFAGEDSAIMSDGQSTLDLALRHPISMTLNEATARCDRCGESSLSSMMA